MALSPYYQKLSTEANEQYEAQQEAADYLTNFNPSTVLRHPQFLQDVRDVMSSQGQYFDNDEDMLQEFFWERNWRDLNLAAEVAGDAGYKAINQATPEIRKKMGNIQKVFDQYPAFWQEGGRGILEGLEDTIPALVLSVENVIPGLSGLKIGKASAQAGQKFLTSVAKGVGVGSASAAPVEATVAAIQSVPRQKGDILSGAQEGEFSYDKVVQDALIGGAAGGALGGVIGGIGGAVGARKGRQVIDQVAKLNAEKAARLTDDPNADVTDIDDQLINLAEANDLTEAQLQPKPVDTATDADVEAPTAPEAEAPVEAEDLDSAALEQAAQEEEAQAQAIIAENDLGRIDDRLDKTQILKDKTKKEAYFDARIRVRKAAIYRSIISQQEQIAALDDKIAKATDPKQVTKLQDQRSKLIIENRTLLDAIRNKDGEKLDDAVTDKAEAEIRSEEVESEVEATKAEAEEATTEEAPVEPEVEAEAPEVDTTTPLQQRASVEMNANTALSILEENGITAKTISELDDDQIGDLLADLEFVVIDPQRVRQLVDKYGLGASEEFQAPRDGTLNPAREAARIKNQIVKGVISDMDMSGLSEETKQQFLGDLTRMVERMQNDTQLNDQSKGFFRHRIDTLAELELERLVETDETRRNVSSFLSREDTFFANEEGKRIAGLGSKQRPVTRRDLNLSQQLKALAENNKAANDLLKGKDKDKTELYKTTRVEQVATQGGRTPDGKNYKRGDIVEYDLTSKKYTIFQVGKRQRKKEANDPIENLINIENRDSFYQSLGQLVTAGQVEPKDVASIITRRKQRIDGKAEAPEAADAEAPVSSASREGLPPIPEGRVYGIRKKIGGGKGYQKFDNRRMGANQSTFEELMGKNQEGWELGHFSPNVNLRKSEATKDFVPFDAEAPVEAVETPQPQPAKNKPQLQEAGDDDLAENIRKITQIEQQDFDDNLSNFNSRIEQLETLYNETPDYKYPQQKRREAWQQLKGIFGDAETDGTILMRDVLRRITNANNGMAPNIVKRDGTDETSASFIPRTGTITIRESDGGLPDYSILAHELFHWGYRNILTPSDKAAMLKELRAYYAPDGTLDIEKLQSMSPFALRDQDALGRQFNKEGQMIGTDKTLSNFNPEEFMAANFQAYIEGKLPFQGTMMQKLGKLLQNFLEYIIPGKKQRLDKSLVPYFDKLYDDNAQSYLSRVVEPETRAGESLVQMRDAFTVQRMDVEDSLNDLQEDADGIQTYGPSLTSIRQMTTALRRAVTLTDDDAETTFGVAMDAHLDRDSVLAFLDKIESRQHTKGGLSNIESANDLVEAFEIIDEAINDAYEVLEGGHLRPSDKVLIDAASSKKEYVPKTRWAIKQKILQESIRENKAKFEEELAEMGNTPDGVNRPSLISVMEPIAKFLGEISFVGKINPDTGKPFGQNAAMLSAISKDVGQQRKLTGILQKLSRQMWAAVGVKKSGVTDEDIQAFANMSDEDFFTEAFNLIDNGLDYLYVADTRLTYKMPWEDKKEAARVTAKNQETVSKPKKRRRRRAKSKANEPNKNKPASTKTPKDKKTKTASNRELDKELRTKPDEAREEAIGAELIRRIRAGAQVKEVPVPVDVIRMSDAQLSENLTAALDKGDKVRANQIAYEAFVRNDPKAKPIISFDAPRITEFLEAEDLQTRGAMDNDGVPTHAPEPIREVVRRITHRDPDTQRVARGLMHRLMLIADDIVEADRNLEINSGGFNPLRTKLRALGRSLTGNGKQRLLTPRETIEGLIELDFKARPLDGDQIDAVLTEYDRFPDDPVRKRIEAENGTDLDYDNESGLAQKWFQAYLVDVIEGNKGERPFNNASYSPLNDVIKERIEEVAYLSNGMMGSKAVKDYASRLTLYGDMFKNIETPVSEARLAKELNFVEGGLGESMGKPVPYFHSTPNRRVFDNQDFIWEYSGPNSRIGPGIYLSQSPEITDALYGSRPTTGAMEAMVRNADLDFKAEQDALLAVDRLGELRRRESDLINVRTNPRGASPSQRMFMDVMEADDTTLQNVSDEIGNIETYLAELGVTPSPGTVEVRVRARNPFDLRSGTALGQYDPDLNEVLDFIDEFGLEPNQGFSVRDLVNDEIERTGSIDAERFHTLAVMTLTPDGESVSRGKVEFNNIVKELGYDSIRFTEYNRVGENRQLEDFEALLMFDRSNVKSPDAEEFNPDSDYHFKAPRTTKPLGKAVSTIIDDPDATPANQAQFYTDIDDLGAESEIIDVMKKMAKLQQFNDADWRALSKYNPLRFLQDNARKLRYHGMHFLGDWAKPIDGTGYHERQMAEFARKVMPLFELMFKTAGENNATGAVKRWGRNTKFWGEGVQPESYKKVVKALRRQSQDNFANLSEEERNLATALRTRFDQELQTMREAGIRIGEIPNNYFPQIWNTEKIQANFEEFKQALTGYLTREQRLRGDPEDTRDLRSLEDIADHMANTLIEEDGVYLPHQGSKYARSGGKSDAEYMRLIRLTDTDANGKLLYGDILNFMEKKGYLADDLQSITSKYFEGTTRRIEMQEKFGTNNHGFYDYLQVRQNGARDAIKLLSTDKIVSSTRLAQKEFGYGVEPNTIRIPEMRAMRADEAVKAIEVAEALIAKGQGPVSVAAYLNRLRPNGSRAYKKRVDAIANGLFENKKFGSLARRGIGDQDPIKFADTYMSTLMGRPTSDSVYYNSHRNASKFLRTFSSVTLLGWTTLTSITDISLPFLRGAGIRDSYNAMRNFANGEDGAEYRAALRSIGASMENVAHQRMSMLYGGTGSKLSNAFFNATMLTPWTNLNREVATATGYEMLKATQKIAQKHYRPGQVSQSAKYRRAKRKLEQFGLGEYAHNDRSLEDVALLYDDARLRTALHRFANESIFTPSKTDMPLWAQDNNSPWGAVLFQLKSYPLMFQRLAAHTFKEAYRYFDPRNTPGSGRTAHDGDIKPLLNMILIGVPSGSLALTAKDILQMRGGDDERSAATRERSFNKLLEEMGYDVRVHGREKDKFLGWAIESLIHTGGFGLVADLLYQAGMQDEKGSYGVNRIMGLALGPSFGTLQAGATMFQGVNPTEGSISRPAAREFSQRVPVLGGIRSIREFAVDTLAGEPKSKKKKGLKSSVGNSLKSKL